MATNVLRDQVIQKAWEDPDFKKELLAAPKAAIEKYLHIPMLDNFEIKVVQETKDLAYLILPVNPAEIGNSDDETPVSFW